MHFQQVLVGNSDHTPSKQVPTAMCTRSSCAVLACCAESVMLRPGTQLHQPRSLLKTALCFVQAQEGLLSFMIPIVDADFSHTD